MEDTEKPSENTARLFGIEHSNRDSKEFWGKNQFNSTFPAALACWMRKKNIPPVYIHVDKSKVVATDTTLTFNDVFNSTAPHNELIFNFETRYKPFNKYVHGEYDGIDLVIESQEVPLRPLEVKLTVLPDQSTYERSEKEWGSEMVIRPVSVMYAALTIYHAIRENKREAHSHIREVALNIADWTNIAEIAQKKDQILSSLDSLINTYETCQVPLIMQPIWKTQGKQAALANQAFDIFVWSNMALCKLFIKQAAERSSRTTTNQVSRYLRASTRLLRCLHDLFTVGQIRKSEIYRMALGNQTDKEFSASGRLTNKYMSHPRLTTPQINKSVLSEIILGGGEKMLSPERRFDATVYFTAMGIFDR